MRCRLLYLSGHKIENTELINTMKNNERYPSKATTATSPIPELETSNNASDDIEPDQGFWRQRKVQRRAFVLLLLVIGVAVGVGVGVGGSHSDSSEFDCSNANTVGCLYIETTDELRAAVDDYLADNSKDTLVARTYGWPIRVWDVSRIQDFSHLFAAYGSPDSDRSNPAAASFSEDISSWDVSNATEMHEMFHNADSFNQPLADWNVASVKDMGGMLYGASSFNQPLADWDVSSVTDMRNMFYGASSFNQPLADWNVSSVKDMGGMFGWAVF
jgi:surface protein